MFWLWTGANKLEQEVIQGEKRTSIPVFACARTHTPTHKRARIHTPLHECARTHTPIHTSCSTFLKNLLLSNYQDYFDS